MACAAAMLNDQAVATKVATTEKNNLVVKHSRLWGAEPGAFMTSMGQNGRRIAGRVIVAIAALCTGERAGAQPTCPSSGGDHVVIDVRFEDPIGGLAIRSAASKRKRQARDHSGERRRCRHRRMHAGRLVPGRLSVHRGLG